jgi:uncharacterized protein YjbI with pentapeptide repeats
MIRPRTRRTGGVDPRTLEPATVSGLVAARPSGRRLLFTEARVTNVDFSSQQYEWIGFQGECLLEHCDFSGAAMEVLSLAQDGLIFRECDFFATRFPDELLIISCRFEDCRFGGPFLKWFSFGGEFVDCAFDGLLDSCTFYARPIADQNTNRVVNEFRRNDFRNARLVGTAFRGGVDVSDQLFGPDVQIVADVPRFIDRMARVAMSSSDTVMRADLNSLMAVMKIFYDEGQIQQLITGDDLPAMADEDRRFVLNG